MQKSEKSSPVSADSDKNKKEVNKFPSQITVTRVEPRGASIGRVGVGDKIVAINGVKLNNIHELNEQLAKPAKEASVTLNRAGFSCCKHACTTVETLTIEKGSSMKVMRAVELYRVQIRLEPFPDMDLGQELGLSVKYDNKERLQVASVVPGTLASVHLRPGDIIREVNGHHIASKTMLAFWIRQGFHSDNQIVLLIETGVEADTHIEMPEDVQNIAQRQLAVMKNMKPTKLKTSLSKQVNPTGTKHVAISNAECREMGICSDYDETTLKHVRRNK